METNIGNLQEKLEGITSQLEQVITLCTSVTVPDVEDDMTLSPPPSLPSTPSCTPPRCSINTSSPGPELNNSLRSEAQGFIAVPASMLPHRTKLHWDICEFVARTQEETAKRVECHMLAQRYCTAAVQALWPRAQVHPYGSVVTGLALPQSDLDLVICLPNVHLDALAEAPGALEGRNAIKETWQQHLARRLSSESWVLPGSVTTVTHTPMPIITFLTVPLPILGSNRAPVSTAQMRLDISFEGPHHNGLATNTLVRSLTHEFPVLRPLVLVLKALLHSGGWATAYTGGLSSYGLLLLVTTFLQTCTSGAVSCTVPPPRLNPNRGGASALLDLGILLIDFLDFIGNVIEPSRTGVSVVHRCFFSRDTEFEQPPGSTRILSTPHMKKMCRRRHRESGNIDMVNHPGEPLEENPPMNRFDPIFIEDPLRKGNNVGRNCFRIAQIRRALSDALRRLQHATQYWHPSIASTPYVSGVLLNPTNHLRLILLTKSASEETLNPITPPPPPVLPPPLPHLKTSPRTHKARYVYRTRRPGTRRSMSFADVVMLNADERVVPKSVFERGSALRTAGDLVDSAASRMARMKENPVVPNRRSSGTGRRSLRGGSPSSGDQDKDLSRKSFC